MSRQKSPAQATHETALTDVGPFYGSLLQFHCLLFQRRIRHITAIQVHNLTPFPARDSLASALSQPAEQSQFTSHGHLSDDLDVTMQRKRSRRTSTNSHRSVPSEDGSRNEGSIVGSTSTERGSKTSGSRIHCLEGTDHRQYPTSGSTPTTRPHRARTTSMASSIRSHISGPSNSLYGGSTSTLTPPINSMSSDNSQAELENVIQSRLVETFITITIPESLHLNELPSSVISPPLLSSASRDKIVPLNAEGHLPRKLVKVTATSPSGRATPKIRRESATLPRISSRPPKSASISVTEVNGDAKRVALQSTTESVQSLPFKHVIPVPHYFSPIHRPSTNPRFTIDTTSNRTLLEGADCNGSRLKIEVWGNVGPGWYHKLSRKGKEKEVDPEREWKILQERDFDLRELVPIPDSSSVYNSQLPLNSLVITLSPPGGIFYLPPPISFPRRSFSPADGCASDPEPERKSANFPSMFETSKGHRECPVPISRRGHRAGDAASPLTSQNDTPATTVGWQDLFNQIRARMKNLHQRKQMLNLAKEQLEQDIESEFDLKNEVLLHQAQQTSLRARFGPTRTTLISILSSIYPIELLSPPDLLYAILDVPLPIPLSCSDPAPPLTLPSRKDVNEDAVATALGYAAQVVQLLSMYLGKSLVYPVTCIGSRSLIRDNISAMVGPRMFPLYSKGVDTYRFEYGVFLLNKDIELLMTDRDLRALDMRHTLPNLKNLLLTLTDGEGALLRQSRPPDSPMSLVSELELASRPESPVDPNSTTPKASHTAALEGSSPLASRSSTPTIAPDSSKKPRSFIAFSPLTDFLRGRHPSSSRISMKSQPDTEEPQSEESSATTSVSENSSDDEDRKTISGVSRGADQGWKVDSPSVITRVEKLSEDSHSPAHSTPPLIVTHIVR
ncbi:hypothetical protein C0989_001122 [Termitomyces sp. Mn162]|nr:hypothetical protein C0989_001122 [Termitomyces sp. Mn162]